MSAQWRLTAASPDQHKIHYSRCLAPHFPDDFLILVEPTREGVSITLHLTWKAHPMGESRKEALRLGFDGSIRLEFHGATVSSNGGLLVYRDVDDALGLTARAGAALTDRRTGTYVRHTLTALLRQSIYSRLAGYDDLNDAKRLAVDPTMRQVVGGRATKKQAAQTSRMARFETEMLTQSANLAALMDLSAKWIGQVQQYHPTDRVILDLDSSVSETHGQQEGSAYNGYFECTRYHPLFCFNQESDLERALLRNGNVASADDWWSVLEQVIARYRHRPRSFQRYFRGDAGFANPGVYEFLEAEGYSYAVRLPSNPVLYRQIQHLMTRPVGRPPEQPIVQYHAFTS